MAISRLAPVKSHGGLRGGVHGSAHVHESKYFFAFAHYDPSLFNLIRCLRTIGKGIGNSGGNFFI